MRCPHVTPERFGEPCVGFVGHAGPCRFESDLRGQLRKSMDESILILLTICDALDEGVTEDDLLEALVSEANDALARLSERDYVAISHQAAAS